MRRGDDAAGRGCGGVENAVVRAICDEGDDAVDRDMVEMRVQRDDAARVRMRRRREQGGDENTTGMRMGEGRKRRAVD